MHAWLLQAPWQLVGGGSASTPNGGDNNQPTIGSTGSTGSTAIDYIKASSTGGGDNFGVRLRLTLSPNASGDTLAVDAWGEDSDATGVGNSKARWGEMDNNDAAGIGAAGAVYLFSRNTH